MFTDVAPVVLDGLLRASWQAAVLVAIVLLLQRTLRRWLTPRWRHALWLIVVARLLLPVTPASAWSVFNLAPARTASRADSPKSEPVSVRTAAEVLQPDGTGLISQPSWQRETGLVALSAGEVASASAKPPPAGLCELPPQPAPSKSAAAVNALSWSWLALALWAVGAAVLAGRVAWTSLLFRRALRSAHRLDDAGWNDLLAGCRQRLSVRRDVRAYEADWVRSPALCGWRRPRLLLPAGLARRLARDELRHVLLHELAHLKRNDILVNWLATVAQVLHWFNPVVWFALRRLRADRELAADSVALAALGEGEYQRYGRTILKLLDDFTRPVPIPAAVGILEDRGGLRERITAIATFRRPGLRSSLASLLVAGLGLVTLTDAQPSGADSPPEVADVKQESPSLGENTRPTVTGLQVSGVVTGKDGQPVAGAELTLACGAKFAVRREARTDSLGRFQISSSEVGTAALLVRADGSAPEQHSILIESGLEPLTIVLEPSRKLTGRVVDERGEPVAGAEVSIERWREPKVLTWRTETDAEGSFTWEDAPVGDVTLAVVKARFNRSIRRIGPFDSAPLNLRLARRFHLTGRVLEAETGRPITRFRPVRGQVWEESGTFWRWGEWAEQGSVVPDGEFGVDLDDDPSFQARVMVTAEGYVPVATPPYDTVGWHEYIFRLKKGGGPSGMVVGVGGEPIAGAQVGIVGCGNLMLAHGRFGDLTITRTHLTASDAQGRFTLPALIPDPRLVAAHPEHGFAEVTAEAFAESGRITLQPWASVVGVMKIGANLAVNHDLLLNKPSFYPTDWSLDLDAFSTSTDAMGQFKFGLVPPGSLRLARMIPVVNRGRSWSHPHSFTVKPGETANVTYGGFGRPLVGRVNLDVAGQKLDWAVGFHGLSTRFPQPPDELRTREGIREWLKRPEVKNATPIHRYYTPVWQSDGGFRIDDVAPGSYDLILSFTDPSGRNPHSSIASVRRVVVVPEMPGGRSDEPLDLGELDLTFESGTPTAGDRKPPVTVRGNRGAEWIQTLSGGPFDANRLAGKYVLTTAWSATSEASRTELLLLKELNAEYANDPRFLMVGHVMDEDLEPARKLVGELQIPWIQLIPTPAMRDHLLTSLPDSTLPVSVFGRHRDQSQPTSLRGEAIRKAVKETLGPPIQFTAIVNDTSSPEMQDINPRLWSAVYSPDGLTIATTAGWDNPAEPGELVLWDVATGQARAVVRQSDTIRTVAFSPDGSRLAIGDFAGYVSFLDPSNGAVVRVLPQQIKLVNSITFTPNGRTLVSGGFDETVRLWDAETGEARQVFALSGQGVVKVAVSPDGQWLAAGTWPGYVHMWRFAKGEKAYEIDAGSESGDGTRITEAVEFSPDSKHLVTGSWDGTLKLWSVETGKLVREFDRRGRDLKGATFSPDGRRLATSDSHGRVEIWSPESGDQIGGMSAHSDMCFGLAFSPNGLWLATAGWDRALRVWDVETQRLITTFAR